MKLKVGMNVYIARDLSETEKEYGVTQHMRRMRGTKQIIQNVSDTRVRICGYSWSLNDVITEEIKERIDKMKSQQFCYDVNQLDI